MDIRTLIETLVRLADDDMLTRLRSLAFEYIEMHQAKLDALKQGLSENGVEASTLLLDDPSDENGDYVTLSDAIERILKTAGRPIGKKEIIRRYEKLYGRSPSENSIGGALFKKKGILFEKVGDKGTRYAKWKLMPEVIKKTQISNN